MVTKFCGTFIYRNSSILFSHSNHSHISDAEWITNGISLIIFVLAFIGNTAALIVMFGSKGPIRITNNKYLANLACADLLRACFMPFTIIARMKKTFMFGKMLCKILPIVQGLSVAVDVFTLVCISIERYLAICRPLLILKLQSVRFSNLVNAVILFSTWSLGLLTALPNLYMYNLCSLPTPGRYKCEKTSPQEFDEKYYMITLDAFYFVIPMVVMIVLYTLIIRKMYRNNIALQMRSLKNSNSTKSRSNPPSPQLLSYKKCSKFRLVNSDLIKDKRKKSTIFEKFSQRLSFGSSIKSRSGLSIDDDNNQKEHHQSNNSITKQQLNQTYTISHPINQVLSQNNNDNKIKKYFYHLNSRKTSITYSCASSQGLCRTDRNRRKALKLLITLIMEFFICWTPLFIYHTIGTFNKNFYRTTPNIYVDLILLFSFASASCNPLTYYFMSKRYRSALYAYLRCCCSFNKHQQIFINQNNKQPHYTSKHLLSNPKGNSPKLKNNVQLEIDADDHCRLRSKTC
ncbi:unnamed protein product [Rotaria sordida]|uniref:G-protein coupled receptors family 1 profile domain-containing protein n=1 Tax=Rotaria sordida TaxID=392033 RepID=A0A814A4X9_9BILA|nr:unnamed protein product [Rotaria sordida]CAF1085485.1 unnamed protein product [Rotaria sordida]